MALTPLQLAISVSVLMGAAVWILAVKLSCPKCGARLSMERTLDRRVEGRGRVMEEMRCKKCGWSYWSRKWSGAGRH